MDTSKYKSVATKMETYHKAKLMAENTHRSIGSYISMVIDLALLYVSNFVATDLYFDVSIIFSFS